MVITYIRGQARKLEHGFSRSVFGAGVLPSRSTVEC